MEFTTLSNGVKMPLEGFGVFQVPDPAVCEQAVLDAIASGCQVRQERRPGGPAVEHPKERGGHPQVHS